MTMKWKGLWQHWFGRAKVHRCFVCYEHPKMHLDDDGIYRCPAGHIFDPNKQSRIDSVTEASKGHKPGDI